MRSSLNSLLYPIDPEDTTIYTWNVDFEKGHIPWNKGKHTGNSGNGFKKGRVPWNKGIKYTAIIGEKHPQWKGDGVGYFALHAWLNRNKGKANHCENTDCKGRKPKKFEWSNISGEYKRDINDYESLCIKCHRAKDLGGLKPWNYGKKLHYDVWNKGKKTGLVPKTAFKKGVTPKGSVLFKKGHIPWNKKNI